MFSESLLEEAKVAALEMLRSGETDHPIPIGENGVVVLTTNKDRCGSILYSFSMNETTFYIALLYKERS